MSRPFSGNSNQGRPPGYFIRINERIRVPEVRVVSADGKQLGVHPTRVAIQMARDRGVDLVEVASTANPPVCRIINFGKFKYELSKKENESKKHQHVVKVKEIQLRPFTDPHDFEFKLKHAIEFLCEDNKVRASLRFRGRENAHQEYGHQAMKKFVDALAAYGKADSAPRTMGRGITLLITPLPAINRAKNPNAKLPPMEPEPDEKGKSKAAAEHDEHATHSNGAAAGGLNNAFANLSVPDKKSEPPSA